MSNHVTLMVDTEYYDLKTNCTRMKLFTLLFKNSKAVEEGTPNLNHFFMSNYRQ